MLSIAVANDPQLPDNGDNQQVKLAPHGLLEGDGKVCVRSARVRWRLHKAVPDVLRGTKLSESVSLSE